MIDDEPENDKYALSAVFSKREFFEEIRCTGITPATVVDYYPGNITFIAP